MKKIGISLAAALALALGSMGCSGQMFHQKVTNEAEANGIRYFGTASYEVGVFRRVENAREEVTYERVGDTRVITLADTTNLMSASYSATGLTSQEFTVQLNKDGTLKSAKLEAQGSNPVAVAAGAASTALTTVDELGKARTKREIEDTQRQVDLLTVQKKLDDLLQAKEP
jgi:hypothetical protein